MRRRARLVKEGVQETAAFHCFRQSVTQGGSRQEQPGGDLRAVGERSADPLGVVFRNRLRVFSQSGIEAVDCQKARFHQRVHCLQVVGFTLQQGTGRRLQITNDAVPIRVVNMLVNC